MNKSKVLSIADIESIARQNLSNFEGEENYEGEEGYDGLEEGYEGAENAFDGEDFVQYDGINLAKNGGQTYTITLTNGNAAPRTALLSGGILTNAVGLIRTGAFNDKNNAVGLSGAGNPTTLETLVEFFRRNALRLNTLQITSSDSQQIYQQMIVQRESPFRIMDSKIINLGAHVSPGDFKDKMVIVPAAQYGLQFDDQTRVEITIPGLATTTITLFTGPILNTAAGLERKVARATRRTRRTRK